MTVPPPPRRTDGPVLASLAVLAVVAWGAILLAPEARYWDDWVASSDPIGLYRDLGLPWMGPIVQALFTLGPWTFKVLALLSVVVVGGTAYLVAGRGLTLTRFERWLVAALVVVLPLNTVRTSLAVLLTYSVSLALFMVAWWLVVAKSPSAPGRLRYVVAALLFFVSFSTASLLLFVVVPAAHLLLLLAQESGWSWRTVGTMIRRFWYLGAAPVAFWVMRTVFFQPTALYEDYNTFVSLAWPLSAATRATVLLGAMAAFTVIVVVLWRRSSSVRAGGVAALLLAAAAGGLAVLMLGLGVVLGGPRSAAWVAVTALVAAIAVALAVHGVRGIVRRRPAQTDAVVPIAATGLLLIALGALPYLAVDKIPSFVDWEVRHQLLMPIGVAALTVAAWRTLGISGRLRGIAVVLVGALAVVSLGTTLTLVADWRKQQAIVAALAASAEVRDAATVVFADEARAFNFAARTYSTFEYHGWLATAFGDTTRYGVDATQVAQFLDADAAALESLGPRYGYPDYVYSTEAVRVDILPLAGASVWDLLFGTPAIDIAVTDLGDLAEG